MHFLNTAPLFLFSCGAAFVTVAAAAPSRCNVKLTGIKGDDGSLEAFEISGIGNRAPLLFPAEDDGTAISSRFINDFCEAEVRECSGLSGDDIENEILSCKADGLKYMAMSDEEVEQVLAEMADQIEVEMESELEPEGLVPEANDPLIQPGAEFETQNDVV